MSTFNISNFLWNIADDVLRDVSVRGKYRDIIPRMTDTVYDTYCYSPSRSH